MISDESRNAAAEALALAANDGVDPDGWDAVAPSTNQPESSVTQGDNQDPAQSATQTQEQASKSIDLSNLTPEARLFLEAREREMTADYTRKTQEVAQQRQEAETALQFIQALNTDPSFAQALYERLGQDLGIQSQQAYDQGYDYDEDPYAIADDSDDPYLRELAELKAWKDGFEAQMRTAQIEAGIDRQIAEIRSADPSLTDDDVNDILGFGIATNGDLHAAHQTFNSLKTRLLGGYINDKASVQHNAPLPSGPGLVDNSVFQDISTVEDPRLRQIAMERLRQELG